MSRRLSPIELRMIEYVCAGLSNIEIASLEARAVHTVHARMRSLYQVFGLTERGARAHPTIRVRLAVTAIAMGLVSPQAAASRARVTLLAKRRLEGPSAAGSRSTTAGTPRTGGASPATAGQSGRAR